MGAGRSTRPAAGAVEVTMKRGPYAEALKPTARRAAVAKSALEAETAGLRLERRIDGQLWATRGGDRRAVWVRRCFPWTGPTRYVSLRDDDEKEFALVRDLNEMDADSRAALEEALAEAGFLLRIARILAIDEEVEIRNWKVDTHHGRRTFQTRLDDWPREVPGGGLLIRDVAGDLYHVPDPSDLDRNSRELLWAFVD
jgi:hypothetical protein